MVAPLVVLVLASCETVPLVSMHDVWDPQAYRPVFQDLSESRLEKNMQEIDEQYAETRTTAKVELSLETSELSVSENNKCAALWRGSRACAWLARHHPDLGARERYASKGIAMGRKAIQYQSTRVEPYYYTALNLGAYAEVKAEQGFVPSKKVLHEAKYMAEMAVAMDPTYDFAGPHRFLGKLIVEAADTLTHRIAPWEEGMTHLQKAVELAPGFGQNRLFLAQAYYDDGDYELARVEAEKLYGAPPPPDYTVESEAWRLEAAKLLGGPASGAEIDVSGIEAAASDSSWHPAADLDRSRPAHLGTATEAAASPAR